MVKESSTKELVFLIQTKNEDLKKQLSKSVAGENVRLMSVESSEAITDQHIPGRLVTFIIGSDVEDPISSAQRLHVLEKNAKIILMAKNKKNAGIYNETIRYSPFLGTNLSCIDESNELELDTLPALLADSVKAERYRAIIDETNLQISSSVSSSRQTFNQHFINKLLDIAPIGIAITNSEGSVLGWNREAAEIFKVNEVEILGRLLPGLFEGSAHRKLKRYIDAGFRSSQPGRPLELERQSPGQPLQVLTFTVAQFENSGAVEKVLILTIKDITEQVMERRKRESLQKKYTKELENKIQERTIALQKANKLLAKKNDELVDMNKELEAFTYASSHDLQEPLRKIQLFTERIINDENQNLNERGKKYLDFTLNTAGRMQSLIEDLLAFSRLQIADREFTRTELNAITKEVIDSFSEVIEENNATIEIDGECKADIIIFLYRQLMQNLISNALKFTKPDTPPHISIKYRIINGNEFEHEKLSSELEYCHITFSDNGIGFKEEYSDKIFEVFQRLHSRDKYPGTGIGLATVKKIVDIHNGTITVTSAVNKGTTFDIFIPVENS